MAQLTTVPMYTAETTLPLTTLFTRPASCTTSWTFYPIGSSATTPLMRDNVGTIFNPTCYPPGQVINIRWSPGVCPSGMTTPTYSLERVTPTGYSLTATCCAR